MLKTTKSEDLLIYRMRKRITQPQAAIEYGVAFGTYRNWEKDSSYIPKDEILPHFITLSSRERYVLLRRRAKLTQAQLGARIGYSRQWVNKMEAGLESDIPLQEYWVNKGN